MSPRGSYVAIVSARTTLFVRACPVRPPVRIVSSSVARLQWMPRNVVSLAAGSSEYSLWIFSSLQVHSRSGMHAPSNISIVSLIFLRASSSVFAPNRMLSA